MIHTRTSWNDDTSSPVLGCSRNGRALLDGRSVEWRTKNSTEQSFLFVANRPQTMNRTGRNRFGSKCTLEPLYIYYIYILQQGEWYPPRRGEHLDHRMALKQINHFRPLFTHPFLQQNSGFDRLLRGQVSALGMKTLVPRTGLVFSHYLTDITASLRSFTPSYPQRKTDN